MTNIQRRKYGETKFNIGAVHSRNVLISANWGLVPNSDNVALFLKAHHDGKLCCMQLGQNICSSLSIINDNYCDCDDGVDESLTAACAGVSNHKFYCAHEAKEILSSKVDDGVCDCCDGQDEVSNQSICFTHQCA